MHALVVCTANICRSTMAQAFLAQKAAVAGLPIEVSSAGILDGGRPSPREIVRVMAERGLDVTDHVSRNIDEVDLSSVDLVLAMERMHVREVVARDTELFDRTFTLPEFVRRADRAASSGSLVTLTPGTSDWLVAIGSDRRPMDLLGEDADDEVADPYGRSMRVHRRAADEIAGLCSAVLDHLFPPQTVPTARWS